MTIMVYHFSDKDPDLKGIAGGLGYLANNLEGDPLLELYISDECEGSDEELELGIWPGTNPGCHCGKFDDLKPKFCNPEEKPICDDIDAIDS